MTGLDVSGVALRRATAAAVAAGVRVSWVHAGLAAAGLPAGTFDLVSAQHPALLRTSGGDEESAAVGRRTGGTLLVVHHAHDLVLRATRTAAA